RDFHVTGVQTCALPISSWALEVGDEVALELLRQVASAAEPAIHNHGGRIVKRVGDGHMAVFADAQAAVAAALDIQERLARVSVRSEERRVGKECSGGCG